MTTTFTPGRNGIAYKEGKLYVFDTTGVAVMNGWPDPRIAIKTAQRGWHSPRMRANDLLATSFRALSWCSRNNVSLDDKAPCAWHSGHNVQFTRRESQAMAAYGAAIPPDVRRQLRKYPNRRWHLLNLFARCPGALELSNRNPALTYMLASNWIFHKPAVTQPIRSARNILRHTDIEILEWLGFPGTDDLLRMLSRIATPCLSTRVLQRLQESMKRGTLDFDLLNIDRINTGVVQLATERMFHPHITTALMAEVGRDRSKDRWNSDVVHMLRMTTKLAKLISWQRCPYEFTSLDQLRWTHDRLSSSFSSERLLDILSIPPANLPAGVVWVYDERPEHSHDPVPAIVGGQDLSSQQLFQSAIDAAVKVPDFAGLNGSDCSGMQLGEDRQTESKKTHLTIIGSLVACFRKQKEYFFQSRT